MILLSREQFGIGLLERCRKSASGENADIDVVTTAIQKVL
jgi:hypothetical protein